MNRHIFVSPHLDDAVLSCGGMIYKLVQSGASVQVITVMAGDLPAGGPRTPYIQEHIDRWQLGPNPAAGRRTEDQRALDRLGAEAVHLPFADLLWRTAADGTLLYPDQDAMFGTIHPEDPLNAGKAVLASVIAPGATIYAPLGAGGHVDHQIVRDAALSWLGKTAFPPAPLALFFYEEYPYSAQDTAAVERAQAALNRPVKPVLHRLSPVAIQAKIEAIACHASQVTTFWETAAAMGDAVRAYARTVGAGDYAERLWQPIES